MIPSARLQRPDALWLLAAPAAALACALVLKLGDNLGLAALGVIAVAPILILVDGAPLAFLMAVLPGATLLTNYGAGVGGLKVLTLVALPCLIVGALLRRQTLKYSPCWLDAAVVGLFVVALVNIALLSLPATGPLNLLQEYGGDLILYFVVRSTAFSVSRLRLALTSFLIGGGIAGVIGLLRYGSGLANLVEGVHRLSIPGQNTNSFASIMLLATGIAFGLAFYEKDPGRRLLWWTVLVAATAAAILTFSRAAFVGGALMILAGLIFTRGVRVRLASIGVILLAVLASQPAIARPLGLSDYVSRVTSIGSFSQQATAGRDILWSMAADGFTHHLWFGLGIGNFVLPQFWYPLAYRQVLPTGFLGVRQAVHNFYLGWAVDAGIVALVFLALVAAISCVYLVRSAHASRSDPSLSGISHGLMLGYVGYFVSITFGPFQSYQLPYILLALVGSLWMVTRSRPVAKVQGVHRALREDARRARLQPRLGVSA